MSTTEFIGIEVFSHFNDNNFKQMVINHLFNSEDISIIIKDYLFMNKKDKALQELKQNICNTIKFANIFTRRNYDNCSGWAFRETLYGRYPFQARNCRCCGGYTNTRSIDTDELCAEAAKCECTYMHLGGGVYFNLTYNVMD